MQFFGCWQIHVSLCSDVKILSVESSLLHFPRESKISSGEKMRIGGSEEVAWMQICEPTEKDKGNYTFELFDGKESYKRTLDLSGQGRDLQQWCNIYPTIMMD